MQRNGSDQDAPWPLLFGLNDHSGAGVMLHPRLEVGFSFDGLRNSASIYVALISHGMFERFLSTSERNGYATPPDRLLTSSVFL
jgi:hypothetical protein